MPACLREVRDATAVRQLESETKEPVRELRRPDPADMLLVEDQVRPAGLQAADVSHELKLDAVRVDERVRQRNDAAGRAREHNPERDRDAELAARRPDPLRLLVLDRRLGLRLLEIASEQVTEAHVRSLVRVESRAPFRAGGA